MYGEKAEAVEELKLDLLDVKAMYRAQTQQLLQKIETLEQQLPF